MEVHQLVGFLAAFAPEELARLQHDAPAEAELRPGRVLGAMSAPFRLRLDVACSALRVMASRADALAEGMAQQLRRSHRWEFAAQFLALVGSGGALALLLGDAAERLKVVTALLGMIGSAVALAVKFMRRDLSGADNGLAAQHRELVTACGVAVELTAKLEPHLRSGDDLDDSLALAALVDQANTLAGRLYTLMKQMGVAVRQPIFEPISS